MVLKMKMQEPQAAAAKLFKLVLGRYLSCKDWDVVRALGRGRLSRILCPVCFTSSIRARQKKESYHTVD